MLYSAIVCCEHQQRMSLITSRRVTRVPGTSRAARREGCCPPTVSSGCHFEYGRQICQRVDISARWTLSLATAFHIYWFFMAYFLASYWKSANIRPWLRQFSLKIGHLCHWVFFLLLFLFFLVFHSWTFIGLLFLWSSSYCIEMCKGNEPRLLMDDCIIYWSDSANALENELLFNGTVKIERVQSIICTVLKVFFFFFLNVQWVTGLWLNEIR